jgi:hypothetical protein
VDADQAIVQMLVVEVFKSFGGPCRFSHLGSQLADDDLA